MIKALIVSLGHNVRFDEKPFDVASLCLEPLFQGVDGLDNLGAVQGVLQSHFGCHEYLPGALLQSDAVQE
jgi:hypothetical protein